MRFSYDFSSDLIVSMTNSEPNFNSVIKRT
jgi:hypothetical protein